MEKKDTPENPDLHSTNLDDFEEEEEQKTADLMSGKVNIKDMNEVQ